MTNTVPAPSTDVPTTSTSVSPDQVARAPRDRRPSLRLQATTLAAGGVVYGLSHVLNLFGSTPTLDAPNEIAAKYLFAAGALLISAGLGAVTAQFARSTLGVISVGFIRVGMLFILLSSYSILYIFPIYGWEGLGAIDERAVVLGAIAPLAVLGGPLLLGIAGLRHRVVPVPAAIALFASVAAFAVAIAVPEIEPPIAIGTTIVFGAAYAVIGLTARARFAA